MKLSPLKTVDEFAERIHEDICEALWPVPRTAGDITVSPSDEDYPTMEQMMDMAKWLIDSDPGLEDISSTEEKFMLANRTSILTKVELLCKESLET